MLMPARLHIDISVVMPMLMFMLMSLVKTGLKVISLFCIVHPYCAYFFASLARTKHIGNMHFEVNIHLSIPLYHDCTKTSVMTPHFYFMYLKKMTLHGISKIEEHFIVQF